MKYFIGGFSILLIICTVFFIVIQRKSELNSPDQLEIKFRIEVPEVLKDKFDIDRITAIGILYTTVHSGNERGRSIPIVMAPLTKKDGLEYSFQFSSKIMEQVKDQEVLFRMHFCLSNICNLEIYPRFSSSVTFNNFHGIFSRNSAFSTPNVVISKFHTKADSCESQNIQIEIQAMNEGLKKVNEGRQLYIGYLSWSDFYEQDKEFMLINADKLSSFERLNFINGHAKYNLKNLKILSKRSNENYLAIIDCQKEEALESCRKNALNVSLVNPEDMEELSCNDQKKKFFYSGTLKEIMSNLDAQPKAVKAIFNIVN